MANDFHAPRLEGELSDVESIELDHDADLDELEIRELTLARSPLHDVRLQRCRLTSVSVAGAHFTNLELRDVIANALDGVGTRLGAARLTRVELRDCRLSGIDFAEATLRHVVFHSCRLDAANFRMVDAEHVVFAECELRDADFGQARLHNVRFTSSQLDAVDFSNARCEAVDLRGARVERITGVTGLRGAIIGVDQVLPLAPAVFSDLGISIRADDD
jgi:uncharacterized protein YjbI with pentapeptide repeats